MSRILYAASSMTHINNFHLPYIKALRDGGHEVKVMARGDGADFDIPFEKKIFSPANAKCRKMIREIIKRESFDAVILNTSLAAYHIRRALPKKARPRVINFVHGYLFSKKIKGLKERLLLIAEKSLRKRTDKILVMNSEDAFIAKKWRLSASDPIMTLGMGAVCKAESVSREEIRALLSASDKTVLSFVGELSGRKNQRMLIEALADLKKDVPNAVLWLVGEGTLRDELTALSRRLKIEDSVVFLGRRDNPCDFIRASDVYVSAARIEGMPFNIIEALGTGTPIVASAIKGHRDLLSGGAGVLYAEGDKDALVRCVLGVLEGGEDTRMKAQDVYRRYSFDNVFGSTYKAMTEALFCE